MYLSWFGLDKGDGVIVVYVWVVGIVICGEIFDCCRIG